MSTKEKKRPQTALHLEPKRQADEIIKRQVLAIADEVFDRYVWGESFQSIADTLMFKISGWKLRDILMNHPDTAPTYTNIGIHRAHNLVDASIDYGRRAAAIGDPAGLRTAIDTNLKVAAKLHAAEYGDRTKMELTGKDGKPLEIKADLSLTAEQAYERLIRG